jgi:deaminated glutathione amidase
MKFAMGQIDSTGDKAANIEKIRAATAEAAAAGAQLVVFPEFAMFEHTALDHHFVDASEPLDGTFSTAMGRIAGEFGITVVAGMLESIEGENRAHNTMVVYGPDGALVTIYRKLHLYDAFGLRESDIIRPGEDFTPVVFPVGDATVGLMTCYDLRFPELGRSLADAGADLVVCAASWTPGYRKEDHWNVLTRARAIENTVYFASISQAPPISTGCSVAVDPMGVVVGELGEIAAVGVYDVDPARVAQVRVKNPSLSNRRFATVAQVAEMAAS